MYCVQSSLFMFCWLNSLERSQCSIECFKLNKEELVVRSRFWILLQFKTDLVYQLRCSEEITCDTSVIDVASGEIARTKSHQH